MTSSTNTVGSIQPVVPDEVTDEQLEQILMRRRLTHEQEKLSKSSTHSSTNSIESDNSSNKAVGPALFVDVSVDGVTVRAMVDTGAQSAIISRTVLHQIGQQRCREGKPVPILEEPTVKLYGKDGVAGGQSRHSWM